MFSSDMMMMRMEFPESFCFVVLAWLRLPLNDPVSMLCYTKEKTRGRAAAAEMVSENSKDQGKRQLNAQGTRVL